MLRLHWGKHKRDAEGWHCPPPVPPKKIQKGVMFMSLPHIHSQMSTRWQVWVKISGGFNVILRGRRGLWWICRTCWKGRKSRFVKLSSWPLRLTSAGCTNMHGQTRGRYQNSCFLQQQVPSWSCGILLGVLGWRSWPRSLQVLRRSCRDPGEILQQVLAWSCATPCEKIL